MSSLSLWFWGTLLLSICLFIHVLGLISISRLYYLEHVHSRRKRSLLFASTTFVVAAFGAACLQAAQAALWSLFYLYAEAIPDFLTALAFSLGSFTTYGSSGFAIAKHYVLLSEIQAMNGTIAISITGAFLFTLAIRLHHVD